jgi:hypothetical protein
MHSLMSYKNTDTQKLRSPTERKAFQHLLATDASRQLNTEISRQIKY